MLLKGEQLTPHSKCLRKDEKPAQVSELRFLPPDVSCTDNKALDEGNHVTDASKHCFIEKVLRFWYECLLVKAQVYFLSLWNYLMFMLYGTLSNIKSPVDTMVPWVNRSSCSATDTDISWWYTSQPPYTHIRKQCIKGDILSKPFPSSCLYSYPKHNQIQTMNHTCHPFPLSHAPVIHRCCTCCAWSDCEN